MVEPGDNLECDGGDGETYFHFSCDIDGELGIAVGHAQLHVLGETVFGVQVLYGVL